MLFSLPFQENGLLVFNQVSVEVDLDLGLHVRHSLLGSGLAQFQQLNLLVELIVVGGQAIHIGRCYRQVSHVAHLFQDGVGLDVYISLAAFTDDRVKMVSAWWAS